MIKALTFAALLSLTGCATVSMVSKEAIVETNASAGSSELVRSAKAFTRTAEAEGWVGEQRGLMDYASALFSSESKDGSGNGASYAVRISASEAEPAQVFETVTADATAASQGFAEIQSLASDRLASGTVVRQDLIHFETALVTAQKVHRAFAEATGIAAEHAGEVSGLDTADRALADFAARIDAASETADELADAYAESSKSASAAS